MKSKALSVRNIHALKARISDFNRQSHTDRRFYLMSWTRWFRVRLTFAVFLGGLGGACSDDSGEPPALAEGIFAALGAPLPAATAEQKETFERGRQVAERRFTTREGLGPHFNVTFCGSCHEDPVTGGSGPRYRNFLLVGQRTPDGAFVETGVNGVQPMYSLRGPARRATPDGTNVTATRNAIPFFGSGLLAELSDEAILIHADPDDADGDGISGRANFDRGFVGRFGRKSQTVSIEGFIRGPLFNHLGITSNPLSDARKNALPVPSGSIASALTARGVSQTGRGQAAAPDEPTEDDDGVADPELSEQDLFDLVSFAMLLAAPEPESLDEETRSGEAVFERIGCAACHVRGLVSPRGLIPLYSDLLLHDMGPELADGVRMKEASGSEFRTQPLWGVAATGPYLHDGRADTVEEAIDAHGGEGEASRDAFRALPAGERRQLLAFVASLGGADQDSLGLLPPDAPVPAEGELGGPAEPLVGSQLSRFVRGRAEFDRNLAVTEGLGPAFNGDSCRACHFEPVIGGAGPPGVNVVRHGYDDGQGNFRAPDIGTMAHRLLTDRAARAPADLDATVFELRQTPALFGLGRLEQIDEAAIVAREDPADANADDIRGVAHRLPDGRLGRFGWKGGVPSLAEFVRDATSNEMGLTVPPHPERTFGFSTDDDGIADPETTAEALEDVTFFVQSLAPPTRARRDRALEDQGEALFAEVRCDACHVPSLPDTSGGMVSAYTDLLLHDVAPAGFLGIEEGAASPRQFRTPPLWGLSRTGPYMHDGLAVTIEDAIARHETEAAASRLAYEALTEDERRAVLAFLESL